MVLRTFNFIQRLGRKWSMEYDSSPHSGARAAYRSSSIGSPCVVTGGFGIYYRPPRYGFSNINKRSSRKCVPGNGALISYVISRGERRKFSTWVLRRGLPLSLTVITAPVVFHEPDQAFTADRRRTRPKITLTIDSELIAGGERRKRGGGGLLYFLG